MEQINRSEEQDKIDDHKQEKKGPAQIYMEDLVPVQKGDTQYTQKSDGE